MPRTARASVGDLCYHALNRGNGRMRVCHKNADYVAFLFDLEALRQTIAPGRPFGSPAWTKRTASHIGIESSLRPRGRHRKRRAKNDEK